MKIKKIKKSRKLRGTNSHGHGSRKKWKGKGHHGGKGMAGTGKRADQKTTLITKKYGNKYFGKQGITSKGTFRRKLKAINLGQIQRNLNNLMKKFGSNGVLVLEKYKILGHGELKEKLTIKAKNISKSAKDKIEKIGGKVIIISDKVEKDGKVNDKAEKYEKSEENIEDETGKDKEEEAGIDNKIEKEDEEK